MACSADGQWGHQVAVNNSATTGCDAANPNPAKRMKENTVKLYLTQFFIPNHLVSTM
jgi:hypothetical protein